MKSIGNTTKRAIRRLVGAFQAICREPLSDKGEEQPLDPSILLRIEGQAARVAEIYDDPLAGEYARRIMTEAARAVFNKYENMSAEATATLLQKEARNRS